MKTALEFSDNAGETVVCLCSDPTTALALSNPALGERADCPEDQREGPDFMADFADYLGGREPTDVFLLTVRPDLPVTVLTNPNGDLLTAP